MTDLSQFHNPYGGKQWRLTPEGIEVENEGLIRSGGEPKTMRYLWEDFGEDIMHASFETGAPVDMIAAMIPIEAARFPNSLRFDPESNRFEPGYTSDEETPHRRSTGLMQTLLSTGKRMMQKLGLQEDLPITSELLMDPFYSLVPGAEYIAHQIERYGPDPVLICGAYNAGSLKKTEKNDWKILTYGTTRMDRYVQWFNDFHACLSDGSIELPGGGFILSLPSA